MRTSDVLLTALWAGLLAAGLVVRVSADAPYAYAAPAPQSSLEPPRQQHDAVVHQDATATVTASPSSPSVPENPSPATTLFSSSSTVVASSPAPTSPAVVVAYPGQEHGNYPSLAQQDYPHRLHFSQDLNNYPYRTGLGDVQVYPLRHSNNYQQEDLDVYKHVYVHVAPEEPAEVQEPVVIPTPKPKKHFKIVFIKAPTVLPPPATYVNLPQPDQEKTLIYVLSKKPDLRQQLVVNTPTPTPPSKPEVFFIRYKPNGQPDKQPLLLRPNGLPLNLKVPVNSYGVPLGTPLGSLSERAALDTNAV